MRVNQSQIARALHSVNGVCALRQSSTARRLSRMASSFRPYSRKGFREKHGSWRRDDRAHCFPKPISLFQKGFAPIPDRHARVRFGPDNNSLDQSGNSFAGKSDNHFSAVAKSRSSILRFQFARVTSPSGSTPGVVFVAAKPWPPSNRNWRQFQFGPNPSWEMATLAVPVRDFVLLLRW